MIPRIGFDRLNSELAKKNLFQNIWDVTTYFKGFFCLFEGLVGEVIKTIL